MENKEKVRVMREALQKKIERLTLKKASISKEIENGMASSREKQEYIEVKAKIEVLEEMQDLQEVLEGK